MTPAIMSDINGKIGVTFLNMQTKRAKMANIKPNTGTNDMGNEISATTHANLDVDFAWFE